MEYYCRVKFSNVPLESEAEILEICLTHGATGSAESLKYQQKSLALDPEVYTSNFVTLDIYFPEEPAKKCLEEVHSAFPQVLWEITKEEVKDWLEEWKKGFESFELVNGIYVVPSWLTAPPEAKQTLTLDPGMAFGTGTHATTQMASYFISKQKNKDNLLDVGCGTGILCILADILDFKKVVGIDIDPEARRVFAENWKINNCKAQVLNLPDIEALNQNQQFNVVVANIIDGVLLDIKHPLMKSLNPGGDLFVTGILIEREDQFIEKFLLNTNLTVYRRLQKEEWVGLWLKSS